MLEHVGADFVPKCGTSGTSMYFCADGVVSIPLKLLGGEKLS